MSATFGSISGFLQFFSSGMGQIDTVTSIPIYFRMVVSLEIN